MNREFLTNRGFVGINILICCIILLTQTAGAGCPPNSEPYYDDGQTVHCRCIQGYFNSGGNCKKYEQLDSLGLINSLNKISAMPIYNVPQQGHQGQSPLPNKPLPKGKPLDRDLMESNCQTFFRALGEELANRGNESWNNMFPLKNLGEPKADGVVAEMEKISQQSQGKWKKMTSWAEAQDVANKGGAVIGGLRANTEKKRYHGHLEVVVPIPPGMNISAFPGDGPFVRDGNEHHYTDENGVEHLSLSTWGAVRASKTMTKSALEKEAGWYLWVPSKPSK